MLDNDNDWEEVEEEDEGIILKFYVRYFNSRLSKNLKKQTTKSKNRNLNF